MKLFDAEDMARLDAEIALRYPMALEYALLQQLRPLVSDAAAALRMGGAPARGSSRGKARASASGPGTRRAQILALVATRPGSTARELAEAAGTTLNTVYPIVRRAVARGTLVKEGTRVYPVGLRPAE